MQDLVRYTCDGCGKNCEAEYHPDGWISVTLHVERHVEGKGDERQDAQDADACGEACVQPAILKTTAALLAQMTGRSERE